MRCVDPDVVDVANCCRVARLTLHQLAKLWRSTFRCTVRCRGVVCRARVRTTGTTEPIGQVIGGDSYDW